MSAEILYRDEEHKFSVYRLADIPDGVPRSGIAGIEWWRGGHWRGFLRYLREHANGDREWLVMFTSAAPFGAPRNWHCCAVFDEHAGPLLAIHLKARIEDIQRRRAHEIGAQRWRDAREVPGPIGFLADDRAAWSAELRLLVDRSEAARRASEPSVGWDPYGDDV